MNNTALKGQELAMRMGKVLLENGAEILRVQDTMDRVATVYGVKDFNAFVLTNALFINGKGEDLVDGTKFKFVPSYSIHLTKISEINQLSREIVDGGVSIEKANERLDYIEKIPYFVLWKRVIACAVGCASVCFMFGGEWIDCLAAFIVGICIELYLNFAMLKKTSKFLTNILASAIAASMGVLLFSLGIGAQLSVIITGAIIRLVPGMAMTVSMRDFFNGDYLSGTIRLIDALSVGGCIGIGVGVVISISEMFLRGIYI